jgi:hypothetical protein
MKYKVIYGFEANPYEIIKDFIKEDGIDISTGDSDPKNRPKMEMTLIQFDTKSEAVKFMEYYSQNCCHSMLKSNQNYEDMIAGKDVVSWITIQDYHLYEWLYLKEVDE